MKKLVIAAAALILLVVLLVFRGMTAFPDRQLHNPTPVPAISIDSAAVAERLAGAIRLPTISHDDRSQFDATAFENFRRYLETHYPLVSDTAELQIINGYSLVYRFEGADTTLKPALFMGHMDVVPVDPATATQWTQDPFGGAIVDGVIWGRGALDDKMTVLALMEAMELKIATGQLPQRTVYFAFGHDEEVGGKDGAAKIAAYFEEADIQFEFVLDEGGAVTKGIMPGIESPVAIIGIAEKGYVNLHLTVKADGGHSSQPPENTGAGILAAALVKVEENKFSADLSAMDANFAYLAHYFPLSTRIALANTWLLGPLVESQLLASPSSAASIRTTTAVTMLEGSSKSNILPTQASAVVNFRILPGDSVAGVRDHIINAIDDERVDVSVHMANEPSAVSSTESFGFRLLEKTIRGTDESVLVAPYLVQGGTDAKHFVNLSDSIYRFVMMHIEPSTMRRVHGVDEQISIDNYVQAIQFYHALLDNLSPNS